ncbi:MAG: hypothetical protein ACLSGS_03295 [Adlercreutzia sp.]
MPAALCMALAYLTCNVALDLTTATNVGFLVALPVVFAPLLSCLVNRRRYPLAFLPFRRRSWSGSTSCAATRGAPSFGLGEILALLSSVALAGALVFGERGLGAGRHHGGGNADSRLVRRGSCVRAGFPSHP